MPQRGLAQPEIGVRMGHQALQGIVRIAHLGDRLVVRVAQPVQIRQVVMGHDQRGQCRVMIGPVADQCLRQP